MSPAAESAARLLGLWLVIFPSTCIFFSLIFAGPLAGAEDISFEDAFVFLMQTLTVCDAVKLTPWAPVGTGGMIISLILGIVALMILAIHIGISAGPMMDPFLEEGKRDGNFLVSRSPFSLAYKIFVFFFVIFPIVAIACAIILGGILAAAEEWPFVDGFVLVLGEVTLTGISMPGTPPANTRGGKVVAVFIAVFAQAVLGLTVALGAVPLLGFDLSFDDSPIKDIAQWSLNSEQKEKLGKADEPKTVDTPPSVPKATTITPAGPYMQSGRTDSGGVVFSGFSPMQNAFPQMPMNMPMHMQRGFA